MNERALWEHVNDERDGNWKLTFVSLGVFAIFLQIPICKVRIFWEGHKIWKNLPLKIWHYSVTSNFTWKIFSNFVAFSEYPNFNKRAMFPEDM